MKLELLSRAAFLALLGVSVLGCDTLAGGLRGPLGGGAGALDERTIADGLREALRVGSERAVGKVSAVDGFLANELIRIAVPEELDKMTSALRAVGFERQVVQLETSMNRAAELASAEATAVFWDAVQGLTIDDARSVLTGGRHAATNLLRKRTSTQLAARVRPIVGRKMDEVGLSRLYGDLAARYNALPLGQRPAIDLEAYVTDETLDGLFTVLAKEEERIREDPLARTTELLQRVFR
jgi:hypothetical protein